jgi:hypothetical protein
MALAIPARMQAPACLLLLAIVVGLGAVAALENRELQAGLAKQATQRQALAKHAGVCRCACAKQGQLWGNSPT